MSWTEIEIDESGRVTVRRGGTLTGETEVEPEPEPMTEPEPKPEPKPKPELVTWRLCVLILPEGIDCGAHYVKWYPSGNIPKDWYPIEAYTQPVETVQQLPEGQEP